MKKKMAMLVLWAVILLSTAGSIPCALTWEVSGVMAEGAAEEPAAQSEKEPVAEPTEKPAAELTSEPTEEPTAEPTAEPEECFMIVEAEEPEFRHTTGLAKGKMLNAQVE